MDITHESTNVIQVRGGKVLILWYSTRSWCM